jgi:hypothetical protein
LDKRFRNIEGAIDIARREECKNEEQWEMKVRNNGSEIKINIDE